MLSTQWVLQHTRLGEGWVWLLLGLVLALSVGVLWRRPAPKQLSRGFILVAVGVHAALLPLFFLNFPLYFELLRDHQVVEWLTAHFLLAAVLFGLVLLIRRVRQRQPAPTLSFLVAGYFVAFWRELEWGEPFFGRKVWHSRNLFRPHQWFDEAYFQRLLQDLGIAEEISVSEAIWFNFSFSIAACVFAVVGGLYLLRYRAQFLQDLATLHRSSSGRWFLLGLGLYVGAQVLEHPLSSDRSPFVFRDQQLRKIDEALELLGAIAFWASIMVISCRQCLNRPAVSVAAVPTGPTAVDRL